MKKISLLSAFILFTVLLFNCEDSVSEDFNDANGNVTEKLIQSVSVISAQDPSENENITLTYNSNGSLNTVSDGEGTTIFVYNNGELTNITGNTETFNVEEVYQSPYDAFETGQVLEYDSNNNPSKILFLVEDYDFDLNDYVIYEHTADISYDNTHNPYFFTLEAAGIIDVLDDVQLNFSMNPQAPEIIQAALLFPMNNPSQIVYRNQNNEIVFTINANYIYDADNYPTNATVVANSVENSEQSTYTATFQYLQ